jgi:hypothetical protein
VFFGMRLQTSAYLVDGKLSGTEDSDDGSDEEEDEESEPSGEVAMDVDPIPPLSITNISQQDAQLDSKFPSSLGHLVPITCISKLHKLF